MNSFHLSVITPEREFFNDEVEILTVETIGGQLCVLAGHEPMVTALGVGVMKIKLHGGKTLEATHSEGFLEVTKRGVMLLSQACEWPDEIDIRRAEEAYERARARVRAPKSTDDVVHSKIALVRAMTRIKVKKTVN